MSDLVPVPGAEPRPLTRVLDNLTGCWPDRRLLAFRLPGDEGAGYLRPDRGSVEVAAALDEDGALRDPIEAGARGLRVEWKSFGAKLSLRARSWGVGKTAGEPGPTPP